MILSFLTNDKIYEYISIIGNSLTPYSIAISYDYIYFLTPSFKYGKKEKIHEDEDFDKILINMLHDVEKTRLKN